MSKRKSTSESAAPPAKKPETGPHWSLGLLSTIKDPTALVQSDELVNVIKDKYPKAEIHYLVLPKEYIKDLKSLSSEHCSLLKHMEEIGLELANKHKDKAFKLGYHAEPSMSSLHLHVISDDMNSECVKTKKHWNSFNTEFFLKSEDVRKSLEKDGKVDLPSSKTCLKYMGTPLKCHKCDFEGKNMPVLKKHISTHQSESV